VLEFSLDDECLLEQVGAILPEVAAYETGALEFLLRGELTMKIGDSVVITGPGLGAGTIEVLVEDGRGVRTKLGSTPTQGTGELARVPAPVRGARVIAVYRGVDAHGEPLVAVGAMPLGK
jgi:hypothetical protein